jgi:hypothetical protein
MGGLSTETLSWLNDILKVAGWVLGSIAVLAFASEWITGRELERRRAGDAAVLRHQVAASQEEARSLRTRLAPRDVAPAQRSAMIEILRASPGAITIIAPEDTEAEMFAERLTMIFLDAGWSAKSEGGVSFGMVRKFNIEVRSVQAFPARAALVRRALEEALGQDVLMTEQRSLAEDEVHVSVPLRATGPE